MRKYLFIAAVIIVFLLGFAMLLSFFIQGDSVTGLGFGKKVAVIPVKGEITSDSGTISPFFTSEELIEKLEEAEQDPSIASILLDIDSPGGEVVATKQITAKLQSLKKPTVSWIGSMGTSGAYYIAAASDYIIADSDSITGSIGVIMISPHLYKLLDTIGIDMNIIKSGSRKSIANPYVPFSQDDKALLQSILDAAHENFKRDIFKFREGKLDISQIKTITDGRIFSGSQAKALGLIDDIGAKESAILKAASLANIEGKPELKHYKKKELAILDLFKEAGYSFATGINKAFSTTSSGGLYYK